MDAIAHGPIFRVGNRTGLWSWRRAAVVLALGSAVGWGLLIGAASALVG